MREGSHHSPGAIKKMRAIWTLERRVSMSGDKNPMKRPEVRAKVSGDNSPTKRPEVRVKIRAANLGDKNSMKRPEVRAKVSGDNAPSKRPEVRAKIRTAILKLGDNHPSKRPEVRTKIAVAKRGDKNPRWMGGINREPYGWEFNEELKEEVRRRDGYRCQLCGVPQAECGGRWGVLFVHHIDYGKKNNDPMNLTALCNRCNTKVNTNRPYWTAFFRGIIDRE